MSWPLPVSLLLALAVAAPLARMALKARYAVIGSVLVVVALVLYRVTPRGVLDLWIGVVLGVGAGAVVGAAAGVVKHRPVAPKAPRRAIPIVTTGAVFAA